MVDGGRLTSREVADHLGVKVETVYAYASRGLLHSSRRADGRGSTFDPAEVEQLRQTGRGRPRPDPADSGPGAAGGARPGAGGTTGRTGEPDGDGDGELSTVGSFGPFDAVAAGAGAQSAAERGSSLPAVRTRLTAIVDGRLYYRGRDAASLVTGHSFEEVAGWLWHGRLEPAAPFALTADLAAALRRTGVALPERARLTDRLRVAVSVAAADDPLRFDLRPDSVALTGRTVIAALVEGLPREVAGAVASGPPGAVAAAGADGAPVGIARRLWDRLAVAPPAPAMLTCLDHALGLLVDHDLAVSTFAARVAASAHADPYAVVSAGLAALDGPLHGGASRLAYRLVAEVLAGGDAVDVVSERLRSGQRIPGFGHAAYPGGDPRARLLLHELAAIPQASRCLAAANEIIRATGRERQLLPHVDLALATLTLAAGMRAEAGEVIFAVARTVGWLAHALEEYTERPLRLRPGGVYIGRPPIREPSAP